jgi:hypothetical protein
MSNKYLQRLKAKKRGDQQDAVNAFVLDYLRDDPRSHVDDLYPEAWKQFAFTREEVAAGGRHPGILGKKLDGIPYVYRPHNLVAIWWTKHPSAHRWTMTADGGSAA